MTAPDPDFYRAIDLDRSATPHALAARINELLAKTSPGPDRNYLEQARAILGEPIRRAIYDRRLADADAPPLTAQDLHELAMTPTHMKPLNDIGKVMAAQLGGGQQRPSFRQRMTGRLRRR